MKNFDEMAQKVWAANDLLTKKVLLNKMVDEFQHPKKAEKFRAEINKANAMRCDTLASNLALNDKDAVVK